MKQTFVVEFTHAPSLDRVSELMLWDAIWKWLNTLKNNLPSYITVQEITVEQNCGTPENTSENSKKPLRLLGNIAWENKIEDGDDYLDDRMNSLIDR